MREMKMLKKRVAEQAAALEAELERRKQLEEQLLRAQRLETAGRIAGQVAHDLNNLLMPLATYPAMIKRRLPEGHPAVVLCDAMIEASQQIADITEDLMALGRRGQLEQQPVDLNQVVEQAVGQVAGRLPTPAFELELSRDLLPVGGSPSQLLRVVANLLANACEAIQGAGLVAAKTENVYVDEPFGRYSRIEVGEYVSLTVRDTGCGIPPEIRERIFEPFFTTKIAARRRGSGLGLSIVYAIVNDHRGYLDLDSEVGQGTTFRIYLPVNREPVKVRRSEDLPGGSETILVVDDDQLQLHVLRQLLETLGYRAETAGSGTDAVAYIERCPVDLLILDMVMPPGIDGLETYRRVLRVRPDQRAIVLSGFARSDRVERTQALGAGAYVRKPVTLEKLARAVRDELDRRR